MPDYIRAPAKRLSELHPILIDGAGHLARMVLDTPALIFSAHGLAKVYGEGDTAVHALRGIDLEIKRGEYVVLLGASGSGKSTLLNILGGLDVPSAGELRFGDHALSGADDATLTAYRREHVGFVFQFYNLIPSLTVRENVALVTDIATDLRRQSPLLGICGGVVAHVADRWAGALDASMCRPAALPLVAHENGPSKVDA